MTSELLAPAGDFAALRAAIGNGADAVYLGAGNFNARRNAANFSMSELTEAIEYAHLRSVRVYLTLNTLIADDEGSAALALAAEAYTAGIDAVILQDIGLAAVLHQQLPDLPLHASTQMTLHDAAGLQAAVEMGISRVILPRELSLPEIRQLTGQAASLGLETEIFIHGALCIAYSGQCLMSSLVGGRSGNRGECAQPCRLPWQRSGPGVNQQRFPWLSPRDQALLISMPELAASGVTSLKIEGRMRGSAYVGQVTAVYRAALDRVAAAVSDDPEQQAADLNRLLLAFNRGGGFTDRYLSGRRQLDFLSGTHSGSHGVELGHVQRTDSRNGVLTIMTVLDQASLADPARGDVLSVRRQQEEEVASAPIGTISRQGRLLMIKGFHPDALAKMQEGDRVYRMNDRQAEQLTLKADLRRTHLKIACQGNAGQVRLDAVIHSERGFLAGLQASVSSPAEVAAPIEPDRVRQQLVKTGGTPFQIDEISIEGPVALTIASLNNLRRQLLDVLSDKISRATRRDLPLAFTADWSVNLAQMNRLRKTAADARQPAVTAYFLNLPDDTAAIACGADRYVLPLLSLTGERAAELLAAIRAAEPASQVMAWLPAATAGRSARLIGKLLAECSTWGLDGLYAGNPGSKHLDGPDSFKTADLTANIFNKAALIWYAGQGIQTASPSPELNLARLDPLLDQARQLNLPLEIPIYGRLRLMTSEYCPIGHNLPGCRICHPASTYTLTDRKQQAFPVVPHPSVCTSDIYSNFLLSAASDLVQLMQHQPQNEKSMLDVRLQFLAESATERRQLIRTARQILQAENENSQNAAAADFHALAKSIADRANCPTSHGHYQRGV